MCKDCNKWFVAKAKQHKLCNKRECRLKQKEFKNGKIYVE